MIQKMTFGNKNFFIIFLCIYFLIGAFYSLNTGISHDEFHEQQNWEFNVSLVKNILFNISLDDKFENFQDKYYGIGFQLISQPFQFLIEDFVQTYQKVDAAGSHLLAKHFVIFLSFFISGIFFYLIVFIITNNANFSTASTILYLLYPYLLGHAFFNPKDIPFLSFWIICTYLSINLFNNVLENVKINYFQLLIFSFITSFLLSIRISGILIFLQYIITFIIYITVSNENLLTFIKKFYKKFLFFIVTLILFTILLYPIYWKNPLLIFSAINYMSNYFNDVCTLTLGKCMEAKNLDPTYIPIWILVKLPFIIILGLLLLPFTEKKILTTKRNKISFGTLISIIFLIPIILILKKVHLYDELRQILFLIPLIFITGVVSLYFYSNKLFYFLFTISISLFFYENIKIYPYQYAWFNTPSRVLDLNKNFELDYWGVSGKNLSIKLSTLTNNNIKNNCVVVSPLWSVKHFLDSKNFSCFRHWGEMDSNLSRPFWAIQNNRNLKKGGSYKCNIVYESKFNLLFHSKDLVTGKLISCI